MAVQMGQHARHWKHSRLAGALFLIVTVAIAAWDLFPLYWTVATALKPGNLPFAYPPVWVFRPSLEHVHEAARRGGMENALVNSIVVSVTNSILSVLVGSAAAYGLARFPLRGKRHVWFWIISNRMLSPVVVALPFFLLATRLGLTDTRLALILVDLTFNVPLVVWIMLGFFQAIPRAIDEAAYVDGASPIRALLTIGLPLALPGLAVSFIFAFIFSWNELMFALVLTRNAARTMPVLTTTFLTGMGVRWGAMAATSAATVLPILIVSLAVSRYIVRGLTLGAVK